MTTYQAFQSALVWGGLAAGAVLLSWWMDRRRARRSTKKLKAILTVLIGATTACASVPELSEGGRRVRLVSSTPHDCRYVGQVEARPGPGIVNDLGGGDEDLLRNTLKNETAASGGNTVEITRRAHLFMSGEAYDCSGSR